MVVQFICPTFASTSHFIPVVNRPDYLWAVSIITSRAFPYSLVDPSDKTSAEILIPLADALNHEPRKKILWKYVNDTLEIITEEDIGAGAQIFNNYGPKVRVKERETV